MGIYVRSCGVHVVLVLVKKVSQLQVLGVQQLLIWLVSSKVVLLHLLEDVVFFPCAGGVGLVSLVLKYDIRVCAMELRICVLMHLAVTVTNCIIVFKKLLHIGDSQNLALVVFTFTFFNFNVFDL